MKDWFKNYDGQKIFGMARWHITGHIEDYGREKVDASRATYVKHGERVFEFKGKKVLKKEPRYLMVADEHKVYTFSIND